MVSIHIYHIAYELRIDKSYFSHCSDYLFNNKRIKGDQRYDSILKDIEAVFEEGYTITVTGHR